MTESTDYHSCTLPKICSNVAAVHAYRQSPWGKMYVIIDWRAQQCCKILCTGYPRFTLSRFNIMELIPNYFILTTISPSDITHEIRVYAMASLSGFWAPVGHHNTSDPVRLSDIPYVISSTVRLEVAPIRPGVLAVHESPLQCGVYRVWLYVQHSGPWLLGSRDHALLCKFRLSLPAASGREFTWRQQSRIPVEAAGTTRVRGISYSGHTPAH
ncbi:hypothetical protein C8R44DRAFT_743121 [Mycena epipterygia]|nr:hypothetical protein C8R44DRAFT_743121 [Mycena epipterygia]